eukprot:8733812-Lingulodinium_polyedra.AAC.1
MEELLQDQMEGVRAHACLGLSAFAGATHQPNKEACGEHAVPPRGVAAPSACLTGQCPCAWPGRGEETH